jgi:hypothetical protein
MGSYQTGLAEDAEMFGSVGLLETAGALDVAHTAGTGAQGIEDAQAGGVGQNAKQRGHAVHLALVDAGHDD